jgi:hypothetical protein
MNKFTLGMVGLMTLGSFGCGHLPNHYQVYINPTTLSPHRVQLVLDGLNEWEAKGANSGISFDVFFENRSCDDGTCVNAISINGETRAQIEKDTNSSDIGYTNYYWYPSGNSWGSVWLPTDVETDDQFTTTVEHEVGHAMGLVHTYVEHAAVMYPDLGPAAPHVMCADVLQYAQVHHQSPGFCEDN